MSQILEDAKKAAEYARGLQVFCDRPSGDHFDLINVSLSLFGKVARLHIGEKVLEQISPRDKWSWKLRGDDAVPFKASVELDGVVFFAIMDRGEAVEYGCPQGVLDAADHS